MEANFFTAIRIDKGKLIEVLANNREKHKAEYDDAVAKYEVCFEEKKEKYIKYLKKVKPNSAYKHFSEPPKPISHLNDYDTIINMLNLTVDSVISLDRKQFKNYVEDEWDWSNQFKFVTSGYANNEFSSELD